MSFENPQATEEFKSRVAKANSEINSVINNIEIVIKGKRNVVEEVIIALSANGHILLKDVPGVGKTLLAKALAKSIHTNFKRIQFTPDLLPTDITGVSIFNPNSREFEFQAGPVFTNILLADEINRASPKTQSALLEAMEERQVSADNVQHKLPDLFFVIATKNPLEHAGTYPLPIAQLDRFMMRISIGYPAKEVEMEILNAHTQNLKPLDQIGPVVDALQVLEWQNVANSIYTAPIINDYIVSLAIATREENPNGFGVSPRASIILKKAARASALLYNRDYVIPDDVKRVLKKVFAHRVSSKGKVGEVIVDEIMQKVSI